MKGDMMMPNQKEMKLKLTRGHVCDLIIALHAAKGMANDGGEKWKALAEEVQRQLDEFDEKNGI